MESVDYIDRHCSTCVHFWSNPGCGQMYCKKLCRRITARKKPCKDYSAFPKENC